MQNFYDAFSISLSALANVPMQLLSPKGLADSTGFMALGIANQYISSALKQALSGMPAAPWLRGIVDGAVMKANFVYGMSTS